MEPPPDDAGPLSRARPYRDAARALFRQVFDCADERIVMTTAFAIGDLLRRRSAFADAEPMLRRAIEAGHPAARQALGRVLLGLDRTDEAMAVLREAADRDDDFASRSMREDEQGAG